MKQKIFIRTEGGGSIGMGHVMRCLALAEMLKKDFEIKFVLQQPSELVVKTIEKEKFSVHSLPVSTDLKEDAVNFTSMLGYRDIVVLDGYKFNTEYQRAIKEKGNKLVCIDDLHSWHQVADVVINYAGGVLHSVYSKEKNTNLFLGPDYILLRRQFLELNSEIKKIGAIKKVFISMGAYDSNNHTQKFTEALIGIRGIEEIHLMLGSINPHIDSIRKLIDTTTNPNIEPHINISADEMIKLISGCDLAICPASTVSLECCAIGIGLIAGTTAENQQGLLDGLIAAKSVVNFGDLNSLDIQTIKSKIEECIASPEVLNEIIKNQKRMIDGKSPERIREIFGKLTEPKLKFRFANPSDVDLYFKWTNDPVVRQNSFNHEPVKYEEHVRWFQSKVNSKDYFFYLFLNMDSKPVGQIRIEKRDGENVISISLDETFRGRSYGTEMAFYACDDYFHKHPGMGITAYIMIDNSASYRIFKKIGFSDVETVSINGKMSYKLYKKSDY